LPIAAADNRNTRLIVLLTRWPRRWTKVATMSKLCHYYVLNN